MRLTLAPTQEELMSQLHKQGWSMGDAGVDGLYAVYGTKGEHSVHAIHPARTEAWRQAAEQAWVIEMGPVSRN